MSAAFIKINNIKHGCSFLFREKGNVQVNDINITWIIKHASRQASVEVPKTLAVVTKHFLSYGRLLQWPQDWSLWNIFPICHHFPLILCPTFWSYNSNINPTLEFEQAVSTNNPTSYIMHQVRYETQTDLRCSLQFFRLAEVKPQCSLNRYFIKHLNPCAVVMESEISFGSFGLI